MYTGAVMSDQQGAPFQQPTSAANDYTKLVFVFNQLLRGKATAALVEVLACTNAGGIAPVGTVDVRMLVNQVDGNGSPQPHGPIYSLPYHRLQGGTFAVIIDPKPGDIGLAVFCSRDSSTVVSAKGPANPASDRVMDFADGMYFGGFLNAAPTSYVAFTSSGIQIVDPLSITFQAPTVTIRGAVHQSGGDSTFASPLAVQGTDVHTHEHSGVTTGGGNTGPPV